MTKSPQRKNPLAIKKLHEIKYEGYVYDLTTENHHFAAGVGNMIVHNTDSVFACFRFRDNVSLVSPEKSLELFKQIIKFGKELIRPFLIENDRELFVKHYEKYFSDELIIARLWCVLRTIILQSAGHVAQRGDPFELDNECQWPVLVQLSPTCQCLTLAHRNHINAASLCIMN